MADTLDEAKAAFRPNVGGGQGSALSHSVTICKPPTPNLAVAGSESTTSFLPAPLERGPETQRNSGRFILQPPSRVRLDEAKAAFGRGTGPTQGTETMEAWIIVTILLLYPAILAALYFILAREIRAITNYAVLVLLDEDVHSTQRSSLMELICAAEAKDAVQLGGKARTAITKVAMRLLSTKLDVNRVAWSLKP